MSAYRKAADRVTDRVQGPDRWKQLVSCGGSQAVSASLFIACMVLACSMHQYAEGLLGRHPRHASDRIDHCHTVFIRAGTGSPYDAPRVVCF